MPSTILCPPKLLSSEGRAIQNSNASLIALYEPEERRVRYVWNYFQQLQNTSYVFVMAREGDRIPGVNRVTKLGSGLWLWHWRGRQGRRVCPTTEAAFQRLGRERDALKEGEREARGKEGRKAVLSAELLRRMSRVREREKTGTVEIRAPHAAQSSTMHVAPTLHLPQNCHSLLGSRHECKVAA